MGTTVGGLPVVVVPNDATGRAVDGVSRIVDRTRRHAVGEVAVCGSNIAQVAGWPFASVTKPQLCLNFDVSAIYVTGVDFHILRV